MIRKTLSVPQCANNERPAPPPPYPTPHANAAGNARHGPPGLAVLVVGIFDLVRIQAWPGLCCQAARLAPLAEGPAPQHLEPRPPAALAIRRAGSINTDAAADARALEHRKPLLQQPTASRSLEEARQRQHTGCCPLFARTFGPRPWVRLGLGLVISNVPDLPLWLCHQLPACRLQRGITAGVVLHSTGH